MNQCMKKYLNFPRLPAIFGLKVLGSSTIRSAWVAMIETVLLTEPKLPQTIAVAEGKYVSYAIQNLFLPAISGKIFFYRVIDQFRPLYQGGLDTAAPTALPKGAYGNH